MDLKNFVAESLSQIIDGIKEAQSRPGGDNVAAQGYIGSQETLLQVVAVASLRWSILMFL